MAKAAWVPKRAQNIQQARVLAGATNTRFPNAKVGDPIPSAWNGRFDGIMVMGLGFESADEFKEAMLTGEYAHVQTRKGNDNYASKGGVTVKALVEAPTIDTVRAIEKLTIQGQEQNEETQGFADLVSDNAVMNDNFFKSAMELRKERLIQQKEEQRKADIDAAKQKEQPLVLAGQATS